MTAVALRRSIDTFEVALKEQSLPFTKPLEPVTKHYFCPGLYFREMQLPQYGMVVGGEHQQEHMCFVMHGTCKVVSEEFTGVISAPFMYKSVAGTKRAIFALTNTVWVTMHATEETDINILEQTLVK